VSCEGIRLGAYLDGELGAGERTEVEAHLGECRACAEELRAIAAASASVKAWRPERRGFRGLPLFAAAAALLAAALLIVPGGSSPRAEGVIQLRAGERVPHAGARDYAATGLARPATIDCAGGTLLASHARFRLEDQPMRTRTKVGAAVAATAAVVIWGSIEVTDRAGRRTTLGEGTHEIGTPAVETAEAGGGPGAEEPQAVGDPFEAVTGVVLLPDGTPAADATVMLTYIREYAGEAPDATALTDASGRFRFDSARREFVLAASKPRVGAVSAYFTPGVHAVLRLRPGARVEGLLLDREDGTPVAGALVSSQMTGGVWGHARAVTGDDGRFVLDGLDPHESTLWIRPTAHADLVVKPRLAAGETTAVELRLARSKVLSGSAVDAATGLPVALTAVEVASNPQRRAQLLGDGRFEVEAQGYGTSVVLMAEGYPDTAASFGNTREQVFRMERGALVRLRARDDADHLVAGARIDLIKSSSMTRWRDLATGEDGDAIVRLPTGGGLPWTALVRHAGLFFEPAEFKLGLGREGEVVVVLRGRAAGRLKGRVLAPGGGAAAGARVEAASRPCFALEDGRFLLDGLPAGRVDVRVTAADATATVQADLRAGEETDMGDVLLREGATITGFVTGPDGRRIERYKVWSWPAIGAVEAGGSFRIAGLERDRDCAVVVQAGNVTRTVAGVRAGTQDLEIRLEDYATIEGRVVAPEGDELPPGISMGCAALAGSSRPFFDITLYMDGSFLIVVPAGRYSVSASADGSSYARVEAQVEARAGAAATLELKLVRGGTVEGKVATSLAAEKVLVTIKGGEPGGRPMSRHGGDFRFDGIPPGDYAVEAKTFEPGFRGTSQPVSVRAGETSRCDLALIATGELLVRAPAGTALALVDTAGRPVEASNEERNALLQRVWEAAGRPEVDKQGREALSVQVDQALATADAEGVWRRLALFPGEYVVVAGERRNRIAVRGGQTTELDLR
jgi:Putative zinc-finger